MSDSKRPDVEEYFTVSSETLRVEEPLAFDCFIHLKENGKIVHWMREGAVVTPARKEKLLGVGILVMNSQRLKYLSYIGARESATKVPDTVNYGATTVRSDVVFGRSARPVVSAAKAVPTKASAPAKGAVDAHFLNAVVKSTIDVFAENFSTAVTFKPPMPRRESSSVGFEVNVASFVALSSRTIRGTVGLCFPPESYRYIVSRATGFEYKEVSPELAVGCGEFMFAIYEVAHPRLEEIGYQIDRAIPTLIYGRNLSIAHLIPDKGFTIPFETAGGPFSFEIGIKTGR